VQRFSRIIKHTHYTHTIRRIVKNPRHWECKPLQVDECLRPTDRFAGGRRCVAHVDSEWLLESVVAGASSAVVAACDTPCILGLLPGISGGPSPGQREWYDSGGPRAPRGRPDVDRERADVWTTSRNVGAHACTQTVVETCRWRNPQLRWPVSQKKLFFY
jgi:hypothetical protein